MKIEESSSALTINYRRSFADGFVYFLVGAPLLALGAYVTGWGWTWSPQENGAYSIAAVLFIELLGIGLLVGATYFLSTMFDKTTYSFDKTADGFVIEGRKSVFNRWSIFGTVSGVSEIVCHVTGDLETFNSEVYLTYAAHGAALQTRKCGTGEIDEDQAIANTIRQFLSRTA